MKAFSLFLALLIASANGPCLAANPAVSSESPHAQAIRLVMDKRTDQINQLEDEEGRWHDTNERTWSAKRPITPGVIDSTHYFEVTYTIDGHVVGRWFVNTRTGQVGSPGESIRIE